MSIQCSLFNRLTVRSTSNGRHEVGLTCWILCAVSTSIISKKTLKTKSAQLSTANFMAATNRRQNYTWSCKFDVVV